MRSPWRSPGELGRGDEMLPDHGSEYGLRACVSEQMPNRPRARRRGAWSLVSSPQLGAPAPRRTRGSRDLKTRRADGDARGTPRRSSGGESSRSAWYVSTDMCVCRANCGPLSLTKLAPSPSCERASHAPPPSSSPLSFVSPHCGDTSALILKRPRWLSQPGDDQIRQAAISPDVGSRTACR